MIKMIRLCYIHTLLRLGKLETFGSCRFVVNANLHQFQEFVCVGNTATRRSLTSLSHQRHIRNWSGDYCCHLLTKRFMTTSNNNPESSINQEEVDKFQKIAQQWWSESGEFAALHSMNKLRVPLIRDGLLSQRAESAITSEHKSSLPLEGVSVVDVGCGGGILSEPLARLGATVLGLDAGDENVAIARLHMAQDPGLSGRLSYVCSTVEDLTITDEGRHDAVTVSEVIEHVNEPAEFIRSCCALLKPGGSIFLTTMNKTVLSYSLAVFAAEQILRIVPEGAHDWNKFISPDDLQFMLSQNGCGTRLVHGMTLNPLTNQWRWISNTYINYALHAVKSDEESATSPASSSASDSSDESNK